MLYREAPRETMAQVPAELTVQSANPRCRSRSRNKAAATGDRQILAVQIIRILAIRNYKAALTHFGLEQAEGSITTTIQHIDGVIVGVEKHIKVMPQQLHLVDGFFR